jgi:hypothetical protein
MACREDRFNERLGRCQTLATVDGTRSLRFASLTLAGGLRTWKNEQGKLGPIDNEWWVQCLTG